ncbi:hypothetical protein PRIPAC_73964, partial [Pristionchus pacificus]
FRWIVMPFSFYLVYSIGIFVLFFFVLSGFYIDDEVIETFKGRSDQLDERMSQNDSLVDSVPSKPSPTVLPPLHKLNPPKVAEKRKGDIFDACRLVDHEPWDDELKSFLNVHYNPLDKCNKTFKPLTQLIEGVLDLTFGAALDGGYKCEGRCLLHITDYRYHANAWESLPIMPDCDVVEARCRRNGSTEVMYEYMHTQIKPIKSNFTKTAKGKNATSDKKSFKPSVYIVLFDSVADTQSIRSFPKTVAYMQKRFNATRIRHMNKVGDNSRPNGYAFLMGEIAYTINKEIFGVPDLRGARTYEQSCNNALDGEDKSVFARYSKAGYRTMVAEDWARGVFNYPKCIGYNHKPVDHYMRPFHLRLEEKVSPLLLKDAMGIHGCREPHMDLMEYMSKFIGAYPDDPKFGFIWMSVLSHDDPNLIFHADDYVQKFYEKNAEEFDNSFVFFMGDHGLRFGRQRNSAAGRREVNNPMLHMIVPKNIRKDFQPRLDANSHELVTMFDLHATFVDIVDYQPKVNFTGHNFTHIPASTEGSSLLRSLNPSLPRNCRTLPIPFDYCPCEFATKPVKESFTAWKMANYVVELMNKELHSFNLTECSTLAIDKKPDVVEFSPIDETNLYKIEFYAKPGKGRFEALVRAHDPSNVTSYTLASPYFNRLNAYGHDGDCITRAPQKPFCYCKSNLLRKTGHETKKG